MPRPRRPWFRFYVEALHDPKLRRMTPARRWAWVAVLAAARSSCRPGVLLVSERQPMDDHDIADLAAMPVREVRKALEAMEAAGMIHRGEGGAWHVSRWADRQFESDDITERTRKHRSNTEDRNVPTLFPGTFPGTGNPRASARDALATESETETDTSVSSSSDSRRAVDNPGAGTANGTVPAEVWDAYAEIRLRAEPPGTIRHPTRWKATTKANARAELAQQASDWWATFEISPRRLAEALIDGTAPRNTPRRATGGGIP